MMKKMMERKMFVFLLFLSVMCQFQVVLPFSSLERRKNEILMKRQLFFGPFVQVMIFTVLL